MNLQISVLLCILGSLYGQERSLRGSGGRRNRFSAPKIQLVNFQCPEDFGYYPHPSDCSKYYVCVFGGALLESCTGGLMYSNELQTCDWPRNVVCSTSVAKENPAPKISASRKKGRGPNAINSGLSEGVVSSASLISQGIDNSISRGTLIKSVRNSKSIFDDASKIRQGRFITKPSRRPVSFNARFQAQETSSHTLNVAPSTPRPRAPRILFSPSVAIHSTSNQIAPARATTRAPSLNQNIYDDFLNLNDTDYYYYYDDILYDDYFEPVVHKSTTPRSVIRTPIRGISKSKPRITSTKPSPQVVGRTPQRSRLVRPSKKPSPASSRSSLITDIWKYPPRRPTPLYSQPPSDVPAGRCDRNQCILPDCSCGGPNIPGNIRPQNVPQIVLLTFDDSVNDLNRKLYVELFQRGRVNPNGCPISATFYISHEWTDYSQVQNLYSDGHEIASHSITHSFGEKFSTNKWAKEIGGQREIMSAYGGVRMEDIRGMRAPFLAIGGNNMFRMLYNLNFTYDSSMPVYENNPPSWPYTFDYKIFHDCMIPPCPTHSYPGLWQVPMVMWQDLNGGRCSMGDACTTPPDAEGVYTMLIKNFERHYTTNRAPMGLFYHAAWFTTPHHKEGFIAFLDTIASMDDVWLVTNWQALQWVRDPQPLSTVKSFGPFGCNYPERPPRCTSPKVCNVWHKGSVRYLKTCQKCPETYPWVGNTGVRSPLNNL